MPFRKKKETVANLVDREIRRFNSAKKTQDSKPAFDYPFVTISREFGCMGYRSAKVLEELLNAEIKDGPEWRIYDEKMLETIWNKEQLRKIVDKSEKMPKFHVEDFLSFLQPETPDALVYLTKLASTIHKIANIGRSIFVGRGAAIITSQLPRGIHFRLIGSLSFRIKYAMEHDGISKYEAEDFVQKMNREREGFIKKYLGKDVNDQHHYHIIINNDFFDKTQIADLMLWTLKKRFKNI